MRTLVLTSRPIVSPHSGYDLRVAHLCAQLPRPRHLLVAPLAAVTGTSAGVPFGEVFDTVELLPPLLQNHLSLRRHLRLSDNHFLEQADRAAFDAATDRIRAVVRERDISHVAVFGGDLAELVAGLDPRSIVLDVCDSRTLTLRRALAGTAPKPLGIRRWLDRLALRRLAATEGALPGRFRHLTTISEPDSQEVARATGAANVHTVPNGVDDRYLGALGEPGARRGVAFWGNLDFAPNAEALRWYVHEVHLPELRNQGVELCVVGSHPPPWLRRLAARDDLVRMHGFVPDLAAAVTPYPVMINPMRIGSGLKNKVLEAFGLGLVVVSTPLGVEAIPRAYPRVHLVTAGTAGSFASAVLGLLADDARLRDLRGRAHELLHEHYRWDAIGRDWRRLFVPDVLAHTVRRDGSL